MASPATEPRLETFADLLHQIGNVPLERIRLHPAPGTATEQDVTAALEGVEKHICELVDGVLVEKPVASTEAMLAGVIVQLLWNYVEEDDLGVVIPGDGPLRLRIGLVRIPDVSFISWDRLPGGEFPDDPIAAVAPDLAVEVLSEGNTKAEMERKLRDYFDAGVRLVWLIQPKTQTAVAYTSTTKTRRVGKEGSLDGGEVLPGFRLPLKEVFARAHRQRQKAR